VSAQCSKEEDYRLFGDYFESKCEIGDIIFNQNTVNYIQDNTENHSFKEIIAKLQFGLCDCT
jgi:hypothetical protein